MSGMSLIPSFPGGEFKMPEMDDHQQENRRVGDSSDSVQSLRSSNNGSPVPNIGHGKGGISRPPGLGGISVPSPIGKPGHSYTSSVSTAQNLTLTPTSSLDGGEMYRQSSPFHGDGPSLSSDYSKRIDESELPPGFTNLGSFDAEDGDHDGLLGLQALGGRDRAHSSPGPMGPYSSSPPVRGQIGTFDDGREIGRPRAFSRDNGRSQSAASRPPRSGATGLSPHTADPKSYQSGYSSSGSRSRDHSPTPPGIISRPGYADKTQPSMDQLASKFGQLGSQTQGGMQQGQVLQPEQHSFQRSNSISGPIKGMGIDQYHDDVGHRPTRHTSDYGVGRTHQDLDFADSRYSPHGHEHGPPAMIHQRRSSLQIASSSGFGSDGPPAMVSQRRTSLQMASSSGYGSDGPPAMIRQRRSSLEMPTSSGFGSDGPPAMIRQRRTSLEMASSTGPGSGMYARNLHRRESLDFVPGHNRYPEGVPVVATNEEMGMLGNAEDRGGYRSERMVSPAQSPVHFHYGSHHSRHPSDMGSSTLSSSPMSLGSAGMRGAHGHDVYLGNRGRHRNVHADDDLSHPLIGEHIDVPGDDRGYPINIIADHQVQQGRYNRQSSVDAPLPHYGGAAAAHVVPTGSNSLPMPKVVYNVKFKRTQRTFALGPRLNRELKMGTYVKVEADRGEDLGIVVGKVPSDKYMSSRSSMRGGVGEIGGMPPPSGMSPIGTPDLKRVIRLATHDEVSLLQMKREEEDELLKICRTKVRQRGLPMNVVDAEYQFDRHKLTFFFEAEGRVDFRELVRDLFSMYKTRIWMQQLDKSSAATCPTAPEEPQAVVMDYGTPIIAPASEYSDYATGTSGGSGAE